MISSITRGPRQSNMELLRLLAMLLVLVVHADYVSLGIPTAQSYAANPGGTTAKVVVEALALVCVNLFVLISGWFGIRPSWRGFGRFAFQCVYFLGGTYTLCVALGRAPLDFQGLLSAFGIVKAPWFVPAYLGLYILSPLLNAYVERSTARQLGLTVLALYIFQTLYDCLGGGLGWINRGYSVFSFLGLYLLAAWLRRCQWPRLINAWGWLGLYLALCLLNALIALLYFQNGTTNNLFFTSYANPLVVLASAALLLGFARFDIGSHRWINWLSASCFAVYLLHAGRFMGAYKALMLREYTLRSGLTVPLMMLVAILAVYLVAILLDQPRRLLWHYLSKLPTFATRKMPKIS